tara:strand:- start:477 stop:983 length:507 start_codon:yes stop_codon:yes gene_type:complete
MTVKVTKPEINVREKISELDYSRVPYHKMPAGSVIRVKHHVIDPGTATTTSTTLIETGLTVTLTPMSSSNKFLLLASMHEIYIDQSAKAIGLVLARDGSRLNDADGATLGYTASAGANYFNVNLQAFDEPGTTSAVTYSVMVKSRYGSTVRWNSDNTPSFLTVLEIAG